MTLNFKTALDAIPPSSNRTLNTYDETLNFACNDYLCLSQNQELITATQRFIAEHGVGATASRLLGGNHQYHIDLERQISSMYNKEAALLFPSGFQCNYSAISSLFNSKLDDYVLLSDQLNHSSINSGIIASKSRFLRYRHLDYDHLEELLQKYPNATKIILSETLFSMDGDILDLNIIHALSQKYNAYLYLDEAHAIGVIGENGLGLSENNPNAANFIVATFGKALGSGGAFITMDQNACNYMINRSHGFIYSTAITPMQVGAAAHALKMLQTMAQQRHHLAALSQYTIKALQENGFNTGKSCSHIIPIIIGSDEQTIAIHQQLLHHGIVVSAVRPPTVPASSARLRISLNTSHTRENIDYLISVLCKI